MKEVPQAARADLGVCVAYPEGASQTYDLFGPVGPYDILPPWIFLPRLLQESDFRLYPVFEILHVRLLKTPVGDRVEKDPSPYGPWGSRGIP
jgi:hypothetical protein